MSKEFLGISYNTENSFPSKLLCIPTKNGLFLLTRTQGFLPDGYLPASAYAVTAMVQTRYLASETLEGSVTPWKEFQDLEIAFFSSCQVSHICTGNTTESRRVGDPEISFSERTILGVI